MRRRKCDCGVHEFRKIVVAGEPRIKIMAAKNVKKRRREAPEKPVFRTARNRCRNPSHVQYHLYGGRGIEFRFESFEAFMEHIGERPSDDHQLDRIDNDGHYEVGNVRWVLAKDNVRNRRLTRKAEIDGVIKPLAEWAEDLDIPYSLVYTRKTYGWSDEEALFGRPPVRFEPMPLCW